MSKPSRQLRYQRAHKADGLCQSCSEPTFLDGERCKKHMRSNGKTIRLRAKWAAVDWSLPNQKIADQLGVSYGAVWKRRRDRLEAMV